MTAETGPTPWRSYVALGDSFSEGLWDVLDDDGASSPDLSEWATANPHDPEATSLRLRGWADLLAEHLAHRNGPVLEDGRSGLRYANLAVRGRLLEPVATEQVEMALDLKPDLVSIVAGGNDILRPSVDIDGIAGLLEQAVARLRGEGIAVLMATGIDSKGSAIISATRPRVGISNSHVWSIARRHGAHVLDLWGMRTLRDPRVWSDDRIHLLADGHHRVAQGALLALGLEPDDPAWDDIATPLPSRPTRDQLSLDAAWLRHHAYPWATRRFRGTSSGARREPKFPDYVDIPAE